VAERAGCAILGGNVTRAQELSLTITVLGSAVAPLRRSGARVGHRVFVTGRLGGPGTALTGLLAGRQPSVAAMHRFVAPVPRIAEARWLADHAASAAIDISDGLLADAAHLARASGVSITLDVPAIPCMEGVSQAEAAVSGEEYELLVTFPRDEAPSTGEFAARFGIPLTEVGVATEREDVTVDAPGTLVDRARGYDHLS
jgi:thiamine-monophosphate kinase